MIPLQNMSHATGRVLMVPVVGSQTAVSKSVFPGTFPEPAAIRTLPLFIRAM